MKIAVHASHLTQDREDGNQTYIVNLFEALGDIDKDNQYHFYYSQEPKRELQSENFYHHIHKEKFAWTQRVFPNILKQDKPDILFMPIQMLPYLKPRGLKSVVTIHDLAFFYYPETFPWKDRTLHKLYVREAIMKSDALIAISQATKDDILARYDVPEHKIHVVYHGVNHKRFRPSTKEDLDNIRQTIEKYKITKPYLLFVGNVQPRKNIQGLIRAFDLWKKTTQVDAQLVVAGAHAWMVDELMKEVQDITKNDIIFTGRFHDEELPHLLWGAKSFILPSFYEGFGLPILEATACGTPVLVANTPSLVEIVGDAGMLFNPHSIEDMAEKIQQVWDNSSIRNKLTTDGYQHTKQFTWRKCAKETLDVIKSVYES